jgi:hypothetical protein
MNKHMKNKVITKIGSLLLVMIMIISLVMPMKQNVLAANVGSDVNGLKLGDITKDGEVNIFDILAGRRNILCVSPFLFRHATNAVHHPPETAWKHEEVFVCV